MNTELPDQTPNPTPKPRKPYKKAELFDGRRKNNLTFKQRSRIGRIGGLVVSRDSARMAEIGRKGGLSVSKDRAFMAEIGRKGGRRAKPISPEQTSP
jgi:general stress protein YciG